MDKLEHGDDIAFEYRPTCTKFYDQVEAIVQVFRKMKDLAIDQTAHPITATSAH
jgi:hypothetical protein